MTRSKPLSRGKPLARGKSQLRRTNISRGDSKLARSTGIARKAMKRSKPRRLVTRAAVAPYVAFVRKLPCISCGARGPSEASHVATSADQKGTGMKVPDEQVVAHCRTCHRAWDGRSGKFAGFTREQRFELAAVWVRTTQLLAVPEDRDQAEAFEALGLGRIVGSGMLSWAWLPGSAEAA